MKLKSVSQSAVAKRKACLLIVAILMTLLLVTSLSSAVVFARPPPGKGKPRDPDIKVRYILMPYGGPELTAYLSLVEPGWTVTIKVRIENEGPTDEAFPVVLRDLTADTQIGSQEVSLSSGSSASIPFTWGVTDPIGNHILEASVEPVEGETDTEDNVKYRSVEVTEGLIHIWVNDISLTATPKGRTWDLTIEVSVTDGSNNVPEASVFAALDKVDPPGGGSAWSEYTDDQGVATFLSKIRKAGIYEFTVHGLDKQGCIYDPWGKPVPKVTFDTADLP